MSVVRIDKKGRLLVPKNIREKFGIKEGSLVKIEVRKKSIVIEPLESIANKYYGVFKVVRWPKDLDEFINEVMENWWSQKAT
ncbi:MAG: AbrB/MazE/SpoVT family DNA-binding domain-containing protein [Nitrososphaerales archaeon]